MLSSAPPQQVAELMRTAKWLRKKNARFAETLAEKCPGKNDKFRAVNPDKREKRRARRAARNLRRVPRSPSVKTLKRRRRLALKGSLR